MPDTAYHSSASNQNPTCTCPKHRAEDRAGENGTRGKHTPLLSRQVNSGDLDKAAENKSKMFRRSTEIPPLLQQERESILVSFPEKM